MPVITFDGPPLDAETKERMIRALTDAVVSVRPGIPRTAYYVYINEHPRDCVGIGGYPLDEYLRRRDEGTLEE
ncbi:MAG: tautomerase family protein [Thermoplasmata archaeon]|nr:tautomerase family protein [Thermoplasmata archaeon]